MSMSVHRTDAFLANAVLLTNLPDKLLHPTNLRDVIYTCGGTRGYTISKDNKMAVVRMQNRIGAGHLFGCVPAALKDVETFTNAKSIRSFTDPVTQKFTMSLVPLERVVNDEIVQRLGEVLSIMVDSPATAVATAAAPNSTNKTNLAANSNISALGVDKNGNAMDEAGALKLDAVKLRAAAGGGQYDEDEDPLNAPEILEAVAAFKKKLEDRDLDLRNARQVIVDKRLEELVKKVKDDRQKATDGSVLTNQQDQEESNEGQSLQAIGIRETSKRGVSNLPAWMTAKAGQEAGSSTLGAGESQDTGTDSSLANNKRRLALSEANQDIGTRKQKIELADGSSMAAIRTANQAEDGAAAEQDTASAVNKDELFASSINWDAVDKADIKTSIRPWVTRKIVEYLGEEEITLIDFVIHQISKHCTPQEVLDELTMVLDEDAEGFVVSLWQKLLAV